MLKLPTDIIQFCKMFLCVKSICIMLLLVWCFLHVYQLCIHILLCRFCLLELFFLSLVRFLIAIRSFNFFSSFSLYSWSHASRGFILLFFLALSYLYIKNVAYKENGWRSQPICFKPFLWFYQQCDLTWLQLSCSPPIDKIGLMIIAFLLANKCNNITKIYLA